MNRNLGETKWLLLGLACLVLVTCAQAGGSAKLGKDLSIYLGCGDVEGPGKVFQVDSTGKVLGCIELASSPYGLVRYKDGLVATLPRGAPPKVVTIAPNGEVNTVYENAKVLPHPIDTAVHPKTGEVFVSDNVADVIVAFPTAENDEPRRVFHIEGYEKELQNLSIAWTKDGYMVLGGPGPQGAYLVRPGPDAKLGERLSKGWCGAVAADPTSKSWVAGYHGNLTVFSGKHVVKVLRCPSRTMAFGPKGTLVVSSRQYSWKEPRHADVGIVNLKEEKDVFRKLFAWKESRIVSIAVARRMPWPNKK